MCPEELTLFITSLAVIISKDMDIPDIDLLSVMLSQLSGSLATISIQRQQLKAYAEKIEAPGRNNSSPVIIPTPQTGAIL